MPLSTWVPQQVYFGKVLIALEALYGQQTSFIKKIHSEVKFLQGLASLQILYLGQVVDGNIEVLQLLQKHHTAVANSVAHFLSNRVIGCAGAYSALL